MGNWIGRLTIKHLLTADDSEENAIETGKAVASIIRSSAWFKRGDADTKYDLGNIADDFEDVQDVHEFNEVLDALYDLADMERVWIA